MPDIAGIETFEGTVVHTAQWDDDLDLSGRKAAVIGTGATAVQLMPRSRRSSPTHGLPAHGRSG